MRKKEIKEIKLHIIDGIRHLRGKNPDIAQAEHDFFEIANHLGLKDEQVCDNYFGDIKIFDCFRCNMRFGKRFASKTDKNLCKYCEEFDNENGEMKEKT